MTSILVLANTYLGLVASIAIKLKYPECSVTFKGDLTSRHRAINLAINKRKAAELLGIDLLQLFILADATICNAYCVTKNDGNKKYIANDICGQGWGVLEFYQLLLMQNKTLETLENYSVMVAAAKRSKVLDPLSRKSSSCGGINLNEIALTKLLLHKARILGVDCILNESSDSCSDAVANTVDKAHLVVDLRPSPKHLLNDKEFFDWSHFFKFSRLTKKIDDERIVDPIIKIDLSSGLFTKKAPLRSVVVSESWLKRANLQNTYGRLVASWTSDGLKIGPAAVNASGYFLSEMDLLLESLSVLINVWDGHKLSPQLMEEYNRRVAILYDSALAFDLLVEKFFGGDNLSVDHDLPELLKQDISLFLASGRLQKTDFRFPENNLWVSLLACLGVFPTNFPSIDCGLSASAFSSFSARQLENIQSQLTHMPSHLEFVNKILGDFQGGNFESR